MSLKANFKPGSSQEGGRAAVREQRQPEAIIIFDDELIAE